MNTARIGWVDYGKGICIILVVMMHSTIGYGEMVHGEGWMHGVVSFAAPFRMPDFFLIAGLFLSRSIHGSLPSYIDKKVIHFAYFYLLWLTIQTALFEAPLLLSDPVGFVGIYLHQLIHPASSLWFIHMLLVFYVVTRILRKLPLIWVFGGAVLLHSAFYAGLVETGWSVTNRFANWYVFFFAGYAFAPLVFRLADFAMTHRTETLMGLGNWAVLNALLVGWGWHTLPLVSLGLGFAGAGAIVVVSALLARFDLAHALRYAGQHSIVIYLTFFVPMKVMQKGFAATGIVGDIGLASLLILVMAVAASLIFHHRIKDTPLIALYERPDWAKLPVASKRWRKVRLLGGKAEA